MLSTEKLLDILAERDLLPDKLLASLRQQVVNASKPIQPEALAKRLVETGHLTPALAQRLMASLSEPKAATSKSRPSAASGAAGPAGSQGKASSAPAPVARPTKEDDLGLAPLEEDAGLVPLEEDSELVPLEEESELVPLDDDDLGLAPLDDVAAPKRPTSDRPGKPAAAAVSPSQKAAGRPAAGKPAAQRPAAASLLEEELAPLDTGEGGFGSLDGLLAAGAMETAAGSPLAPLPSKSKGLFGWLKRGRAGATRRRENVWESPVLLISGGLLVGLVILGAALLWVLGRQSGDEALTAANEEYRAGSYAQAIHKFDQFLDRFPHHNGASRARVTRGIARLRQATTAGANWPAALAEAQRVLKEIQPEDAFGESAGELAAMLPAIAEGLAERARQTNDADMLRQAREALELAGNRMIVPTRLQPTAKLSEMEAQLALVDRQIHQGVELDAAIAAIADAVARNDTKLAYAIRRELLQRYPTLSDDAKLAAVTMAVSAAQQAAVETTEVVVAADVSPLTAPAWTSLALAERATKEPLSGGEGAVFVAVIGGSAYGFEAARGRLLWQTYLGVADGFRASVPAVPANADADADWFVVSPDSHELWRLHASTGQPRWRLPLGEPMDAAPVPAGEQLLVAATRAGRLHLINPESGESMRQIALPQPVDVAPAVDAVRGLIYQPADHSNLFVLSAEEGRCLGVVPLGHAPGSISTSPVLAGGVLLVPINDRARTASLRVYGVSEETAANASPEAAQTSASASGLLRELQVFRFRGQLDASPVATDRSIVAITDLGAVHAYELSAADPEKPLAAVLDRQAPDTEPLTRYGVLHSGRLYLAEQQLTRFDMRTAEGRLAPRWVSDEQSAFLQPPRPMGDALIHVRRRRREPGVIVAAVHVDDGRLLWQTRVAVPPADRPVVGAESAEVVVVGATGAVYRLTAETARSAGVLDEPSLPAESFRAPVGAVFDLGDGVLATAALDHEELSVFTPSELDRGRTRCALPGKLACLPTPFQQGILAPCFPGHVFLIDPRTNQMLAAPFQPPLPPGSRTDWRVPTVGENGQVAIADGGLNLFSLAMEASPAPHWKPLAALELAAPITRPLASVGNMVFAVDDASTLTAYELPELTLREQRPLGSRCVWGPERVGRHVLLATEAGGLACFDGLAKRAWEVSLPDAPVVGVAALGDGCLLVATSRGVVYRIDSADGREVARATVQRPLGAAPAVIGSTVVLYGRDGSLYCVEVPE